MHEFIRRRKEKLQLNEYALANLMDENVSIQNDYEAVVSMSNAIIITIILIQYFINDYAD
jgi:hypothetical protein